MTSPARDHTGETYGVATAIGPYHKPDSFGRRLYRVFWACCGNETIERQGYLTKIRTQNPKGCRDCYATGRPPVVLEGDTPGYLDVPGWGRVFVLRGPMGPRWSVNGTHSTWAKVVE